MSLFPKKYSITLKSTDCPWDDQNKVLPMSFCQEKNREINIIDHFPPSCNYCRIYHGIITELWNISNILIT